MTKLVVSGFSCIDEVEFELKPVVAIIGPQGSGKSITTKLTYFFSEILNVFLKAGALSRRKKNNTAINEIVPRQRWTAC